jgi:hypothetical protein
MQFHSIRMVEVRQRPFEGRSPYLFLLHHFPLSSDRSISFPTPDLGRKEVESKESSEAVCVNPISETEEMNEEDDPSPGPEGEDDSNVKGKRKRNIYETRTLPPQDYLVSRSLTPMKGHTAFLTFAVCPEKKCVELEQCDVESSRSILVEPLSQPAGSN